MVHVKLTDVDWLEVTVLTVIFFMDCVGILTLNDVASVNRKASESTGSCRHL